MTVTSWTRWLITCSSSVVRVTSRTFLATTPNTESGSPSSPNRRRTSKRLRKPNRQPHDKPRKLTFKEKREYEQLENDIAMLEAEQQELEEALCSGTLSVDELVAKSKRLPILKEELDEKSMRWLELSEIAK